jgi:hypothetical protein
MVLTTTHKASSPPLLKKNPKPHHASPQKRDPKSRAGGVRVGFQQPKNNPPTDPILCLSVCLSHRISEEEEEEEEEEEIGHKGSSHSTTESESRVQDKPHSTEATKDAPLVGQRRRILCWLKDHTKDT